MCKYRYLIVNLLQLHFLVPILIIQRTPYLSVNIPNVSPQNCFLTAFPPLPLRINPEKNSLARHRLRRKYSSGYCSRHTRNHRFVTCHKRNLVIIQQRMNNSIFIFIFRMCARFTVFLHGHFSA